MPFAVRSPGLLKQQRIAVSTAGDLVVMHLGNVEVKLPYEAALTLSQWLRVRGKEAKAFAGDTGRHWSVLGVLSDAERTRG